MTTQTLEFRTEVRQLLDLMIHSLYSHREVFLRELISNASDAIDKARIESLLNPESAEGDTDWRIRITVDKQAGTLTVSDNGIGMTYDEAVEALGTIAHSGTKDFLMSLQGKDVAAHPELIGQFGVGFYSSFMVADRVTVITRRAGDPAKGTRWESTADGTFTVEEVNKERRGTDVTLHLKDEEKKYLEEWEIRSIVKKYSDFIEHPIVMEVEREEPSTLDRDKRIFVRKDETLNSRKALWLRDKSEITPEEYKEFYRHISHDFQDPLRIIHYKAEGTSEFSALVFIPPKAPLDILYREYKIGPMLYVRRVKIMDHCEEIIPPYLRFMKGVVDSSDLPLNVSREILQNNRQVDLIKKSIVKKVFDTLRDLKSEEYDRYVEFYREFGRVLKEGLHYDYAKREEIGDLLLFPSTRTEPGSFTTLQSYIDAMQPEQQNIYYFNGQSLEEALNSPYLEVFREKNIEVLIMLDEIDDFLMEGFDHKGKKLKSVVKGDIDLGKVEEERKEKDKREYDGLISFMVQELKDLVKDVRPSGRLTDSACCLVADEGDLNPHMEQMLKAMGQNVPGQKRILEINTSHPVIAAMRDLLDGEAPRDRLKELTGLLYDQALILEGSKPRDPAAFARSLAHLMEISVARKGAVKESEAEQPPRRKRPSKKSADN
jgi:molecular chaperone HtpG